MKNINKFVTFLVLIFIVSLFNFKNVFAEEVIQDVAPFSNELKQTQPVNLIQNSVILDQNTENNVLVVPKVTSPQNNGRLDGGQIITGEVESGYNIKVYIDGNFRVTLNVWPSKTGVSGFFYQPIQKLSLGQHNVQFVATKDGKDYGSSEIINFEVIGGYLTPDVLTPYYYADDPSTFVIRGYGNAGNKIEVYVDDVKVRYINSLYGNEGTSSYFALAVKNLKDGNHKAYVLSYDKTTGEIKKSKTVYFKVDTTIPATVENKTGKEQEINDKTKTESNKNTNVDTSKNNTKVDSKNANKTDKVTTPENKKNNSMLIGIILLISAVILITIWFISENREKVKKFIDNLFEEDDDLEKKKQ